MASRRAIGERLAMVHILNVECGLRRQNLDENIELYGTGRLPDKYETVLEKYFGTDDKRKMMQMAWKMRNIPVLCPSGAVQIVDKNTGDMVEKFASMASRRGK
jgi:hypothetical protein